MEAEIVGEPMGDRLVFSTNAAAPFRVCSKAGASLPPGMFRSPLTTPLLPRAPYAKLYLVGCKRRFKLRYYTRCYLVNIFQRKFLSCIAQTNYFVEHIKGDMLS